VNWATRDLVYADETLIYAVREVKHPEEGGVWVEFVAWRAIADFTLALSTLLFGRYFEPWPVMRISHTPKRLGFATALIVGLYTSCAHAQNAPLALPDANAGGVVAAQTIPEISDANLPNLSLPAFGAVSLRASLAGMNEAPAAASLLQQWVGRGNVVFLHTDAAGLFGMQTVEARAATADSGGLLVGQARAALPFGSHPLLLGADGGNGRRGFDPTRLPGIRTVFYSLRDGDALVGASGVATPLLRVDDAGGAENAPLYVGAIASVGAGWAIFCPDTLDSLRGDGGGFGRAIRSFIPDRRGARFIGLPSRVLGADASPATVGAALQSRLSAVSLSDGSAALPGFGTAPAIDPAPVPTAIEPVLPLERSEAAAILASLNGPDAAATTALLAARMQWQLGQTDGAVRALQIAAQDPNLAPQVAFWNGCFGAQGGADVALTSPARAGAFDLAARAFSSVGSANIPLGGPAPTLANGRTSGADTNGTSVYATPVSPLVCASWSRTLARLAAIEALAPPDAQSVGDLSASATVRFYPGDTSAGVVASLVEAALRNGGLGPRAPHLEVSLFPSLQEYTGFRRALGAPASATFTGAEVVGNHVLLLSGANQTFGMMPEGADAPMVARSLALANLSSSTDGARPLPAWIVDGVQGRAIGLRSQTATPQLDADTFALVLRGATPVSAETATRLWNFLIDRYGVGASEELVARLTAGANVDEALAAATDDDEAAFEAAFRRSG